MFNPKAAPVQVYGLALLTLPVGFFAARNQGDQVAVLKSALGTTNPKKLARLLNKLFGL